MSSSIQERFPGKDLPLYVSASPGQKDVSHLELFELHAD